MNNLEIKQRHFNKVYANAKIIECACGCGLLIKDKDKYARDKKYISGHNGRKYKDPTQHKREWNHRNRKARYIYKKDRGHKRKAKLIILKGGKCLQCGLNYNGFNACVFDFHHLRDKLFLLNILNLSNKSWEIILEEASKCQLLCSNCHRIKTSGEY